MGDQLLGQTVGDGFRLITKLAQGGIASVYRAEHADGRRAAVKVLHPLYRDVVRVRRRFEREIEFAARLGGCRVPQPLGRDEVDELPCLLFEYIEGQSLAQRLARARPTAGEAVTIIRDVLGVLDAIHRRGVIHRDIKPANVMLLPDGGIKLLDLGLAILVHGGDGERSPVSEDRAAMSTEQTAVADPEAEEPMGTPAYTSPEQVEGRPIDRRSDLYAVGTLLFELLTGQRPFRGDPVEVLSARVNCPAPPLRILAPSFSPQLEAIVARSLAKEPEARFSDAALMASELAHVPEAGGPA